MPTTTIPVADGALPVLTADPAGGTGPALVFVPSIYGIGPDVVGHAAHFARAGAFVVALDSFWRTQPGPIPVDDPDQAIARMRQLDPEKGLADVHAAIAWAKADPRCNGRTIGLGVCFGGPFVFLSAADGLLDGVVTWHGSRLGSFLGRADDIQVPMSLHFGDADPVVPMEQVEAIRAAFAEQEDVEVVVYPDAGHGFSHSGTGKFDPAACAGGVRAVEAMVGAQ